MTVGAYTLGERITVGENAQIFRAVGPLGDVAVKLLHPHLSADLVIRERFVEQTRRLAALQHPNLVRVVDIVTEAGTAAAVMELLSGPSLPDCNPAAVDVRALIEGVLSGLSYLHERGLIHRDLKPGHLVFAADGTPKLIDIGSAELRALSGLTRSTIFRGTVRYADPSAFSHAAWESAPGSCAATARFAGTRHSPAVDLYSVGAIIAELIEQRADPADAGLAGLAQELTAQPWFRPRTAGIALDRLRASASAGRRMTECLYCGDLMPLDAPLCLACGREAPVIRLDPNGEYLTLDRIDQDAAVLGPFLRKLRLLSAAPNPQIKILTGDARMYSRAEKRQGTRLPARIADGIAEASIPVLIELLEGEAGRKIHITRRDPSKRRLHKRGPLIRLRERAPADPARLESLRAAVPADPSENAASQSLAQQCAYAVSAASSRLRAAGTGGTAVGEEQLTELLSQMIHAAERHGRARMALEAIDLHAAYAEVERGSSSTSVFTQYAELDQTISVIETQVALACDLLEQIDPASAQETLSRIVRVLR